MYMITLHIIHFSDNTLLPYTSVLKCELSLTQENSAVYNCEQTDKINIICSKTEGFSSKTLHNFEQIFKN